MAIDQGISEAELSELAALADYEEAALEVEAAAVESSTEIGWAELRREVMRRGGIAAGPYTRHWLPGQTYRVNGQAPDVLAADMRDQGWGIWEDADAFLATLWTLFDAFKAAQLAVKRARLEVIHATPTATGPELPVLPVERGAGPMGRGRDSADLPLPVVRPVLVRRRLSGRPTARRGARRSAHAHLVTTPVSAGRRVWRHGTRDRWGPRMIR